VMLDDACPGRRCAADGDAVWGNALRSGATDVNSPSLTSLGKRRLLPPPFYAAGYVHAQHTLTTVAQIVDQRRALPRALPRMGWA
jgi:hypothetical protein